MLRPATKFVFAPPEDEDSEPLTIFPPERHRIRESLERSEHLEPENRELREKNQ